MSDAVITTYECTRCQSQDRDRGHNPPAPKVLSCWNCGAGRGKSIEDQTVKRIGMFPIAVSAAEVAA